MLKVVAATTVGGLLSFDILQSSSAGCFGITTGRYYHHSVLKPKMDACHLIIGNWDSLLIGIVVPGADKKGQDDEVKLKARCNKKESKLLYLSGNQSSTHKKYKLPNQ